MSRSNSVPRSGVRPRGPVVLVVDGDDEVRERNASELALAGFMVLEAPDAMTAMEKALQFGPQAVVLELSLPGIDGLKVARRLRVHDRTTDVAIVALASAPSNDQGDDATESLARAAGCDSFLTKPLAPATLIAEVVRVVALRSRATGRIQAR